MLTNSGDFELNICVCELTILGLYLSATALNYATHLALVLNLDTQARASSLCFPTRYDLPHILVPVPCTS